MRKLYCRILAAIVSMLMLLSAAAAGAQTPPPVAYQSPPSAAAPDTSLDPSTVEIIEGAGLLALMIGTWLSSDGGSNTSSQASANLQPWERNHSDGGGSYSSHEPDHSTGLYGICHNPMGC